MGANPAWPARCRGSTTGTTSTSAGSASWSTCSTARGSAGQGEHKARDLLGEVYEYFLGEFARAEGKRGGEFFTPPSVVRVLVEVLEPTHGRVYDPCCGSGGMFVQTEKFSGGPRRRAPDIAVYGQELNERTWRMAKMNLAIHGLDSKGSGAAGATRSPGTSTADVQADFVMANPPFNIKDWAATTEDPRWKFGVPPASNANYAWMQHIISKLAPGGSAGVVMANGSMSSNSSGEGDIRAQLVEADLVSCMVALPTQLFRSTGIPVCLWFFAKDKSEGTEGRRRPQRPGAVHRRPRARQHGRSGRAGAVRRRHRQDRQHVPCLAWHSSAVETGLSTTTCRASAGP